LKRFKGVIFGWMNMELMISREGYFYYMCEQSAPATNSSISALILAIDSETIPISPVLSSPVGARTSCAARNNYLTSIYTVGVSSNIASYVLWGVVLDWLGPRITGTLSISCSLVGNILLALANDSTRRVFHPAMIFIGAGGIGVHLSGFHLANLAPLERIGLASSIFPCIFNTSAIIYAFFNLLNAAGASMSSIFTGMSVVIAVAGCAQFWIQDWKTNMRPKPVPKPEPLNIEEGVDKGETPLEDVDQAAKKVEVTKPAGRFDHLRYLPNKTHLPFMDQILSWWFLWTLLFIASVLTRNAFWQGSVARQLRSYGATTDTYAVIISWYPIMILGLFPFVGAAIDKYGIPYILGVSCIFQVLYAGLALVPIIPVQLVTGVVSVFSRTVVMTGYFACVAAVCGYGTFGKVSGLAMAAGGLLNFTSIPLNSLINNQFDGDFFWVQMIELIWGIPLCAYPYYLWRTGKEEHMKKLSDSATSTTPTAQELDIRVLSNNEGESNQSL
jgi:MFS family permease